MSTSLFVKLMVITSLMSFSNSLQAQDSLSLEDALKVALKQNFDILLTEKAVEVNQIQNTWGQAGRFPTVTLSAQQGNNISDQSNNPTSFIQALLMTNSLQGGANVNWTLFNGFRVRANKEKLEQLELQSEGNATLVIENTIQGIILNYYQAKLQQEKILLLNNVIELSKQKWEYQKLRQDLGVALTVDLLQYESAFYQDSTNLIMQHLAYDNAIRNLNLIMGVDESKQWDLTDEIEVDAVGYDFEALKEKMLSSNQNIKNEFINIEILARDITLAKATMYPVVGFNAGAQFQANSFKIGDFPRAQGVTVNYYANFTLNFTLYDGGKVKRGIQALEVQNEVNEIQLDKLKSTLSSELKTHYDLYEARLKMFDLTKKSFRVAQKNFDIAKLKESSGLINSFAFRDIEMAYLTTGLSMIETGFNLIESQTNLAKLTGGLLDE